MGDEPGASSSSESSDEESSEDSSGSDSGDSQDSDSAQGDSSQGSEGESESDSGAEQGGDEGQSSNSSGVQSSSSSDSGTSQSSGKRNQPRGQGNSATSTSEVAQGHDSDGGEAQSVRSVIDMAKLQKLLAQNASKQFKDGSGIKTGQELLQEVQNGRNRFDAVSLDGKLTIQARGSKAIVQATGQDAQNLADLQKNDGDQKDGKGDKNPDPSVQDPNDETEGESLGGKVGKAGVFTDFTETLLTQSSSDLPSELVQMLPILRELDPNAQAEVLRGWIELHPSARSRSGAPYRLLKAMAHVNAIKAQRQFVDVSDDAEKTFTQTGERQDFASGNDLRHRLNVPRTLANVIAAGGVWDNQAVVRDVRVTTDAPELLLVIDISYSMKEGDRFLSALAAAQALVNFYQPMGATFGLMAFSDDPAILVRPPEVDGDKVVDGILSLAPTNGTSYARGLELAYRVASPKSTIVVIGDFLDDRPGAEDALAMKHQKELSVVGIIAAEGNILYANSVCDQVMVADFSDPSAVALTALTAIS